MHAKLFQHFLENLVISSLIRVTEEEEAETAEMLPETQQDQCRTSLLWQDFLMNKTTWCQSVLVV